MGRLTLLETMTKDEGFNWYGYSNPRSGYGIVNLEYSTALERLTGKVSYGWERLKNINSADWSYFTDEQRKILEKPYVKERVGVIKTIPLLFQHNTSTVRIGYTMVENTQIGKKWVDLCNGMDAIFVPSAFLVDVFKNCGVKPPVIPVKQGVDIRRFKYVDRKPRSKFVFGTVGYQDERKNWQDLVRAFSSEFSSNEPVELWIKNSNPYFNHMAFKDPRIKVINRMYTFDELTQLYSYFDCFVFPSHAEGSGLPPREAMATGLPVILTDWSGLSEVANPQFSYPLHPVAIDVPDVRGPEQPGFMARIDIQELMFYMRHTFEHFYEGKAKGKLASDYVRNEWSWDICAADLYSKLLQF